ncbi:dynein heavy chain, cytoplasmic [Trichomonascus vanleenenianus]|uniref:dynein heavy chain n=1 Tax=Trichomonascus vanleenenianus TaxID=2268995 RepID=UPI003ECA8D8A
MEEEANESRLVSAAQLLDYVRTAASALLGADLEDLNNSLGVRDAPRETVEKQCQTFAADASPLVLFLIKDQLTSEDETLSFAYRLDSKFLPSPNTVGSLVVIKPPGALAKGDSSLSEQLQALSLPSGFSTAEKSPYEILHSILHFAVAPYFDAYCNSDEQESDDKLSAAPSARKKITELELSLLHLQQNAEVPELTLSLHPYIAKAIEVAEEKMQPAIEAVPEQLLSDTNFLNTLQSNVNNWIKSIQAITRIDRDPRTGTAAQEISFWIAMEASLENIEKQLSSPGVTLTLDVLRHAKRFHATVSFISDTGIKEATEKVARYNQLMHDFPLDDLISASSFSKIQQAVTQIFTHLNKKLRISPYPIWKALVLVEAISADLDANLRNLLAHRQLMHLDYDSLTATLKQTIDIFATWDECVKEFTNVAREMTRKRSEKFIPIRINPQQAKVKERIEYILEFRSRHEELVKTLEKVLGSTEGMLVEFDGINPLKEINEAYAYLKKVDSLDTTDDGCAKWNQAEQFYDEKTTRVEQAVIAILRDRLAIAKNSTEMFQVFSKFNALFIRPAIRGAIQEYQTRLIDNVKSDISSLQERFRQHYANSEAHEMSKLRDIPSVSGTVIWIKQIEHQLNAYLQRVEDVLGKGWHLYAEGQKLYSESQSFRKKLDTQPIYDDWLRTISKRNLSIEGFLFKIHRPRNNTSKYELVVNFDPNLVTSLFKEVRNLAWLNHQVPHSVSSSSKIARMVYPYAISLIDTLQAYSRTMKKIEELPEVELLLHGYQSEFYRLIAKGAGLRWESFVHAYDIKTFSGDNPDSKHARFVTDFDQAVSVLNEKAEYLFVVYSTVKRSLEELETCSFDTDHLISVLATIQDCIDKLILESYSNVPAFVNRLNSTIKSILVGRCVNVVETWISSFTNGESTGVLANPLNRSTHELSIKNQLISLQPPIEAARVEWLKNLQSNIGAVYKIPRIDAYKFDVSSKKSRQRTFSDIAGAASEVIFKAYQTIDRCISQATGYLEKWFQFQSLWDLEAEFVYERLGTDMAQWLQLLNEIRRERATFDTTELCKSFGYLDINFQSVQSRINSKYDIWQHDVIHKFSEQLGSQMREVCSEMEFVRRNLENQVLDGSTEMVVSAVTTAQSCNNKLEKWDEQVSLFRSGQTALARNRFQFPSNWLFIDQIDNEWAALKEILSRKNSLIDGQIDAIRARVSAEIKRVSDRIQILENQWHEEKPVSGTIDSKNALSALNNFHREAEVLTQSVNMLTSAASALELEHNFGANLSAVKEEIDDFNSVWGALDSVWSSLNDLRETPWASIIPRKVRQRLEEFVQTTKDMPTRIRQYSAFEHVQNHLKNLIRSVSIISGLKSEAIHERHWDMLFKSLNKGNKLVLISLSLGQVWDMNLLANQKFVQEVIDIANGELALDNFLKQIREHWTTYSLELVNYQNACRLIKNWEDLFQTCSDHLNSLQAMHHSPYFRTFEEETRAWEEKLNRVHVLFDVWIDVQRQWVYLEGVFNNNSEIKHVLPIESSRFQNINSEFFLILRKVSKSPLVLDVLNIPNIQSSIERLLDLLNKVQKALGEYFEKERQRFARFYFIGDEDLLEIIGNSNDISRTEKHLSKMFSGISSFEIDQESSAIIAVRSKEGEVLKLSSPVSLVKTPNVVDWLKLLEEQAKLAISDLLTNGLSEYTKIFFEFSHDAFINWTQRYPTQVALLATAVQWSRSVDQCYDSKGNLQNVLDTVTTILKTLASTVLTNLSALERAKYQSLITELIHQRDVIAHIMVGDVSDFYWSSQLTYSFDETAEPLKRLQIRQAGAEFDYGYEYLGVPDKLVCTPLIEKCFLTMTQAFSQRLGGSPFGPAGTGKTEAVKALGQALGKHVLVFCCDETFDFQAIGRILVGLCQVGAWGCFDEFNRLDEHILSAVSSQIETIELGLKAYRDENAESVITLIGRSLKVDPGSGIFITMNPGYAGRNSLPENLKKLFRSFSMAKPDKEIIADVFLNSQGFVDGTRLSKLIVPFFEELGTRLSPQIHYDFGLRALKSVLATCGGLKRARLESGEAVSSVEDWEAGIVLQSLRETIAPKLISADVNVMKEIEDIYFQDVTYDALDVEELRKTLVEVAQKNGLIATGQWLEKSLQLYRFIQIHHGIMLVGNSGTGKTTTYRTLLNAIQSFEGIECVHYLIDAKVMSKEELYGSLDTTTREWTDGLFTGILRRVSENLRGEAQKRHWIVFDGDVDPEWVENLNSVLDDNKILTLPNGERIALPPNVRLLFEVENLRFATPATVSRCGMIWFGDNIVLPQMQMEEHLTALRYLKFDDLEDEYAVTVEDAQDAGIDSIQTEIADIMKGLIFQDDLLSKVILRAQSLEHIMEFSISRSLRSLQSFMKFSCRELRTYMLQNPDFPPTPEQRSLFIKKRFALSLVWSFAGDSNLIERSEFGAYILSFSQFVDLAPSGNLLDFDATLPEGLWQDWLEKVPKLDLDTHSIVQNDVVIPTVDTCRHDQLIYGLLNDHKPIILCGPPGSGKTMTLFSALRKSPNLDVVGLNFSKATTPELVIKSIEQYCEYKKTMNGTVLSPNQIGRWLVVFCDEINLPEIDRYGTQRVISLLRQMVEQNGFWKEKDKQWVTLSNIQFVGACNPPTDVGRNQMTMRFLRHSTVVLVDYPGETSLHQIYGAYNSAILKCVPELRGYASDLTHAMVEVYQRSQTQFTPKVRSHYIYSPRELTRWCRGIYGAIMPLESLSIEGLVRLWAHEALRLFHDRLVDDDEKRWTKVLIKDVAYKYFINADLNTALKSPILYSNWLSKNYLPVESEELKTFVKARVKTFCEEELDTPLILFDDLLDHVLRIDRVLRQPQGHLILIGISGSGKSTLSRFVAWMNGLKVEQLSTSRTYGQVEFDADLRGILRRAGCNGEKICFILDESNILESSFLERMNTLLANGEVPGLFEGDDYTTLMTACKDGALRQGINLDSEDELYKWFTKEIVRNLHVIFTMNPPSSDLSSQSAASPALFNRCVLNWMGDWSDRTLYQVSGALTSSIDLDRSDFKQLDTMRAVSHELDLPTSFRETVLQCMVYIHRTVSVDELISSIGSACLGSNTPGNFLEFVEQFATVFTEKRTQLEDQQRHYNVGLDKLKETVIKVKELRSNLAEKKAQLEAKSNEAKDMLRQMVNDQNEAERKREASIEIQHALDIQEKNIGERQQVVMNDLARAEPAVLEAQQSVSNIKKQHLTELRSMHNPPDAVKMALESVCILLGNRVSSWKDIQHCVRRDDFIPNIVNFDNETQMTSDLRKRMEKEFLSLPNYNFETVNRASKACGPLLQWVIAQVDYSSILERVGPLRDEVMQLEQSARHTKAQAQAISDMIEELETSIEQYKDQYEILITDTQNIKREMAIVERKVTRSMKLLESLSSEKSRWSTSIKEFERKTECLAGNCLLSASLISYAGAFDQQARRHLANLWMVYFEESGIPYEANETLSEYLAPAKLKLDWHEDSLPKDDLCVENAIMSHRAIRYPFIIDPTNRMVEFYRSMHKTRELTVTSFLDKSFIKHLESALRFGNPILIQDAEHLDPIINQVLNKEYKRTGGRTLITLGKQDIDFSSDFRLYLMTRDPSITISPHISSRTTIINFTVTRSSLESQALSRVLQSERPDIEIKHKEVIKLQSEYQVHLRQLEIGLLQALSNSEGGILENDKLIDTLERLKVEAGEITEKVQENENIMATISDVMTQYQPLAEHCGYIFTVLEKLVLLNGFYQFSLEFFLDLFGSVISRDKPKASPEKLVAGVIKDLYLEVYKKVSPSMLTKDRSILAFFMVAGYSRSNCNLEIFGRLVDKMSMLRSTEQGLSTNMRDVLQSVLPNSFDVSKLGESVTPEEIMECYNGDDDAAKQFYKAAIVRGFSANQFVSGIDDLCRTILGKCLLYETCEDLADIVAQVAASSPIALATADGSDPSYKVDVVLSRRKHVSWTTIAMGSSEEEENASRAIESAAKTGGWVLLQNVHLSPAWLEGIEKKLKILQLHNDFRMIYTIPMGANVPTTLLRMSRILMVESPKGVKASMRSTYEQLSTERLVRGPVERNRLFYLVSWVHSIIQERLNFVPLGWTKSYDFNDSDFECATVVIDRWLDAVDNKRTNISPAQIPWAALRTLITETIYGGKIDKAEDRATLDDIVNRVLSPEAYNIGFKLVDDGSLSPPEGSKVEDFKEWINSLPDREPPTWLGLPGDADDAMLAIEGDRVSRELVNIIEYIHRV